MFLLKIFRFLTNSHTNAGYNLFPQSSQGTWSLMPWESGLRFWSTVVSITWTSRSSIFWQEVWKKGRTPSSLLATNCCQNIVEVELRINRLSEPHVALRMSGLWQNSAGNCPSYSLFSRQGYMVNRLKEMWLLTAHRKWQHFVSHISSPCLCYWFPITIASDRELFAISHCLNQS